MKQSYNIKIWRLYCDGHISLEYFRELQRQHREKLDKRRKFKQGAKIESLTELLEQTWVMWRNRTLHIKAVKSWQLSFIETLINEGALFRVVENKKEKTIDKPHGL